MKKTGSFKNRFEEKAKEQHGSADSINAARGNGDQSYDEFVGGVCVGQVEGRFKEWNTHFISDGRRDIV